MPNKYETEKFEYVFVDIEWNQIPGTIDLESREPIQIGVLATDENMNIKKTFSKAIRLSNQECYNPDVFSLTRLKLNSVMQTNSEETVLQKFKMSFPRYKYVVVWTNETYKLLRIGMDKYGLKMPKHRVVIFQQIIMHIAGNGVKPIGFELALKNEKIEYKKNYLHCSKHDVNYMYQLFCKCYDKYIIWTNHEYCYLNKRTHIVHTNKCRYIRINQKSNLNKTTKEVIFRGNRICKTCGYEYEWNRLQWNIGSGVNNYAEYLRKLPLTEENMSMICNIFQLEYSIATDAVFIRTSFSRWIIHICNNKVIKLYHENYKQRRSEALKIHKKFLEGYHNQKLPSSKFYDVVSYIKNHDDGMMHRLGNKNRIEIIIEKIKEHSIEGRTILCR